MSQNSIPEPDQPKRGQTADGKERRVGVELEFSGMKLDAIVAVIHNCLGGTIERHDAYSSTVANTLIGEVNVEFDASLFTDKKLRGFIKDLTPDGDASDDGRVAEHLEKVMATAAATIVPFEVIFPPLEISQLGKLELVREALRADAEGTGASIIHAFGLHLNPELPGTDIGTILRYLRAFLCLYEDLLALHDVDLSRRLGPFIERFPEPYVLRVLDPGYKPDLQLFIDDYLADNPTRNRPLDLLPLLAWLDETRIRERLPDEKISKRPTLHYRLPDCRIDESDWTITAEWNRWIRVEHLAESPDLDQACVRRARQILGKSKRPVIAITGPDRGGFPAWLFTRIAIFRAGATAIRLRPGARHKDGEIPPFDALILGGGADVDPGYYRDGSETWRDEIDATDKKNRNIRWWLNLLLAPVIHLIRRSFSLSGTGIDPARDDFEQRCLKHAIDHNLPVLGICRGAQLINIHFGGDLHRDLGAFYGEAGNLDTVLPRKQIEIQADSRLKQIFECNSLYVNSLHHQAVDQLGEGLQISARDDAGVIQAIEKPGHRYLLGVQWHPEYLPLVAKQQDMFRELVRAARCARA